MSCPFDGPVFGAAYCATSVNVFPVYSHAPPRHSQRLNLWCPLDPA